LGTTTYFIRGAIIETIHYLFALDGFAKRKTISYFSCHMKPFLFKLLTVAVFVVLAQYTFCQDTSFQALLDSGKASFKRQRGTEKEDYSQAFQYLSKAVQVNPGNTEARYFFGYTLDRLSAVDGDQMNLIRKEMTARASEQFEILNSIEKKYTGEMAVLDPYSKISSIWGSLAQAYLSKNLPDSAAWAFAEGKKRGGFLEPTLAFNRQLLNSCGPNGILVTVGDNLTIPCWYLQTIERLRPDITVVDANLVNTGWYPKYLKNTQRLAMGFSDVQLDTINYCTWTAQQITIKKPGDSHQQFSWLLKPTYYGGYILKGDRVLLDILQHNLYKRDFYFSNGIDTSWNLFLGDYLTGDGIVARLRLVRNDLTTPHTIVSKNFALYNMDGLDASEINKSPDALGLLNSFRWAFYSCIYFLHSKGELTAARALLKQMIRKFDPAKLPYDSKELEDAIDQISSLLK